LSDLTPFAHTPWVKSRLDLKVSDLGATRKKHRRAGGVYSVEVGKPAAAPKPKPAPQSRLISAVAALAELLVVTGAARLPHGI
jgi:hypothetical protein